MHELILAFNKKKRMPWSNGLYSHKTDDGRSQKLKLFKLIFEKILTCVRCQIQGDSE